MSRFPFIWVILCSFSMMALTMAENLKANIFSIEGIRLSREHSGFVFQQQVDNEKEAPGLGFTFAYHDGEQGEATVYIYNKLQAEIPNGPMSQSVRKEFDQATQEIFALGKLIKDGQIDLVGRYGTGTPKTGPEFLCAEFILTDSVGSRRTFLYLSGAGSHFVKIRVTLKTNDATDPTARNFADSVASQLWNR